MKEGTIKLSNTSGVSTALSKYNYILVLVGIAFIFIDFDLFSEQPKYLITKGFGWKGLAIAFQIIFVLSLIQWHYKKKKIIDILYDGISIRGNYISSTKVSTGTDNPSTYYMHLFEYTVNNTNYDISFKTKSYSPESHYIIYKRSNPKNAVGFADLRKDLQELVESRVRKVI